MQVLITGCMECPCNQRSYYYSCSVASKLISHNLWDVPVEKIHPETLRNRYRDTGSSHGVKIGRDVFFTTKNLESLGYQVDLERYLIPEETFTHLTGDKANG